MEKFKLKQVATSVPEENVQDVKVILYNDLPGENLLLVTTSEGWVRVNLVDKTFAVGAYEG